MPVIRTYTQQEMRLQRQKAWYGHLPFGQRMEVRQATAEDLAKLKNPLALELRPEEFWVEHRAGGALVHKSHCELLGDGTFFHPGVDLLKQVFLIRKECKLQIEGDVLYWEYSTPNKKAKTRLRTLHLLANQRGFLLSFLPVGNKVRIGISVKKPISKTL